MITNSNIVAIIADDLTGANDTALQFKNNGADTNILLDKNVEAVKDCSPRVWAISTETRNVEAHIAFEKVKEATELFVDKYNPDFFYKKIDSTVRGNIAVEVMSMLKALDWDGAIIIPAFPQAGRITVGGYQLQNGIPIERTEMALDPHSPITESHLPTLLKAQLGEKLEHIVGVIDLKVVLDGAGPILKKINELIKEGKKIIIADSTTITDIEQIVLAMQKTDYKILPVGNAAAAKVLSNEWFPKEVDYKEPQEPQKIQIPKLPKLIVSGSATHITANQIETLENNCIYCEKTKIIELGVDDIINGVNEELANRIAGSLEEVGTVLVHTSNLFKNFNGFDNDKINEDLTKSEFVSLITGYLASLTSAVLAKIKVILITLGGETSYKCCNILGANQLKLIDEVVPAIALSQCKNSDQLIITKSGNLGKETTIMDILRYLEAHEV